MEENVNKTTTFSDQQTGINTEKQRRYRSQISSVEELLKTDSTTAWSLLAAEAIPKLMRNESRAIYLKNPTPIIGGWASEQTGVSRPHKDVDLLIAKEDEEILKKFAKANEFSLAGVNSNIWRLKIPYGVINLLTAPAHQQALDWNQKWDQSVTVDCFVYDIKEGKAVYEDATFKEIALGPFPLSTQAKTIAGITIEVAPQEVYERVKIFEDQ